MLSKLSRRSSSTSTTTAVAGSTDSSREGALSRKISKREDCTTEELAKIQQICCTSLTLPNFESKIKPLRTLWQITSKALSGQNDFSSFLDTLQNAINKADAHDKTIISHSLVDNIDTLITLCNTLFKTSISSKDLIR